MARSSGSEVRSLMWRGPICMARSWGSKVKAPAGRVPRRRECTRCHGCASRSTVRIRRRDVEAVQRYMPRESARSARVGGLLSALALPGEQARLAAGPEPCFAAPAVEPRARAARRATGSAVTGTPLSREGAAAPAVSRRRRRKLGPRYRPGTLLSYTCLPGDVFNARATTWLPDPVRIDGHLLRPRSPDPRARIEPLRYRTQHVLDLGPRAATGPGRRARDRPTGHRRVDLGVGPDLLSQGRQDRIGPRCEVHRDGEEPGADGPGFLHREPAYLSRLAAVAHPQLIAGSSSTRLALEPP